MAESKPLPTASKEYSADAQDLLLRTLELYLYQISNEVERLSFGKSTAISLYSKRELLLIPKLGIDSIT